MKNFILKCLPCVKEISEKCNAGCSSDLEGKQELDETKYKLDKISSSERAPSGTEEKKVKKPPPIPLNFTEPLSPSVLLYSDPSPSGNEVAQFVRFKYKKNRSKAQSNLSPQNELNQKLEGSTGNSDCEKHGPKTS